MKKNIRLISAMTALIIALSAAGCSAHSGSTAKDAPTNSITEKGDSTAAVPGSTADSYYATKGADDTAAGRKSDTSPTLNAKESVTAIDDVAAEGEMYAADKTAPTEDIIADREPAADDGYDGDINQVTPAGLLTAGEWNDNDNWGFFSNLVNSDKISFPSFNIDPRFRTAVTVKSSDGSPVINAAARLIDKDGNVIWEGVTDKKGIVYLFGENGTQVEIESMGSKQSYEIKQTGTDTQMVRKCTDTSLEVTFEGGSEAYKQNDIMFILDTTGSMGDEMLFLQSEFTAITNEIGTENTRYSVNFYRDTEDEYVTKCNDFTDDIKVLQQKLNAESATGGGDEPEAVAEALTECIGKSSWGDKSVKLAFLIFDAPPHNEKASEVEAAVKEAAKKGIRLIPIVSSNSERNTELFGRAGAIVTGGTYVFLTDDSNIGDSHLEPIIGEYKVEKLYDIIIRVINEYRQ